LCQSQFYATNNTSRFHWPIQAVQYKVYTILRKQSQQKQPDMPQRQGEDAAPSPEDD
jgi:hypothetical protein